MRTIEHDKKALNEYVKARADLKSQNMNPNRFDNIPLLYKLVKDLNIPSEKNLCYSSNKWYSDEI